MPTRSVAVILLTSMCSVAAGGDKTTTAWSKDFEPPAALKTQRLLLEPLGPQHTELDFKAVTSSRAHLRKTLHWGDWPADDMTIEANRRDLERHWKEFEGREAYAYTVLTPDRKRCVGCVYLKPIGKKPQAAGMAFWVAADELANDLDHHLLEAVLEWIGKEWPLDTVVLPLHTDNSRAVLHAKKIKLRPGGPPKDDMVRFVWQRGR